MRHFIELTGQKFTRLRVLSVTNQRDSHGAVKWLCKCDCGNEKVVSSRLLRSGQTKSCGCLNTELRMQRGRDGKIHGKTGTKLYNVWAGIKRRCYNQNQQKYKLYGARGIIMCDEWKNDYAAFERWAVNNGYKEDCDLSIDRIDNDGNYEPDNCRIVNRYIQANNTRLNNLLTYKGVTKTMAQWGRELGFPSYLLGLRITRYGWSIEKAFETPLISRNRFITFNGKTQTITEWAREYGLSYSVLKGRLDVSGLPIEKALNAPKGKKTLRDYLVCSGEIATKEEADEWIDNAINTDS